MLRVGNSSLLMSFRLLLRFGMHLVDGNLGPLLLGLGDEFVDGFVGIRVGISPVRSSGITGISSMVGIVDLGERVLHQELVQSQTGARHREVAFGWWPRQTDPS